MNENVMSKSLAAKEIGVSIPSVSKLIEAGLLDQVRGKITKESVDKLVSQKTKELPKVPAILLARKNGTEWLEPQLHYSPETQQDEIDAALENLDPETPNYHEIIQKVRDGRYAVTGHWVVRDDAVSRLIGGTIAATTLGYVHEAAEIIALAYVSNPGNRKVFITRPYTGAELEPWICYQDIMPDRIVSWPVFSDDLKADTIPEETVKQFFDACRKFENDSNSHPVILLKNGRPQLFIMSYPAA